VTDLDLFLMGQLNDQDALIGKLAAALEGAAALIEELIPDECPASLPEWRALIANARGAS
jgi:hypothetical protein